MQIVCLRLHDVKMSRLVLLMFLYILMILESGTLGPSGALICSSCQGVIMHPADGENETFLLMSLTRQDSSTSEPQLQTLTGS